MSMVAVLTISCKDNRTSECAKAYDMIKKCLPSLAVQTKEHGRICVETYNKSSTRGSILCAKQFSNCEQFKSCLNYSSMCRDFTGKQFEPCLKSADKCANYKGMEFKNCIKCINEKNKSGDELNQCIKSSSSDNLPVAPVTPKDNAPAMKPATPDNMTAPAATPDNMTAPVATPDNMTAPPPAMN